MTGGVTRRGLPHLPGVPHLQVNQPLIPGGTPGNSWQVCRPVLHILTLFETKKMSLFTPVFRPDLQKSILVFRPGFEEIMSSLLGLEQQQKKISKNPFRICIFFFLSQSFGTELVQSGQFTRKPYPIPDQNRESLYPFSDQNAAKPGPTFWGGTYLYCLYRGVPPGALNQGRSLKASVTHLYLN